MSDEIIQHTDAGTATDQSSGGVEEAKATAPNVTPFGRSDIISVFVGKQKVEFGIYKGILVAKSPFFEKWFGVGVKETNENVVNLLEDEPSAFEVVVEWVYANQVRAGKLTLTLVKAYVLAEKLCMPDLQNGIADSIRLRRRVPRPYHASGACRMLPEGCPLRDLLLDQFHFRFMKSPNTFKMGTADTDVEVAVELKEEIRKNPGLATALFWKTVDCSLKRDTGGPMDPRKFAGCNYHVHEDGKKCK
ncbi:hypothetical protein PV04_04982 [Phialophora macrospora]|uniref:BTB domain-containing protein n=1 Tax=Phialophora macrospora TaxID=1851006 RepID=A0A0D2FRC0_9EURO|nr:hypothetical protein PV04_04982 [Phialophora macrospora]